MHKFRLFQVSLSSLSILGLVLILFSSAAAAMPAAPAQPAQPGSPAADTIAPAAETYKVFLPLVVSSSEATAEVSLIAAGEDHTCALTADGAVWCWGDNSDGQLGDGSTTNSATPVAVTGMPGNISAIAAGYSHTCALTADGAVWCWGNNYHGQLGDGSTTDSPTPVAVTGLPGNISAIAAGFGHTCALTADGAVWCWGYNGFGQLGDGSTTSSPTPVAVTGLPGTISAIAAGYGHTCALTADGAVWCWGNNWSGQLGDGNWGKWVYSATPVAVTGLPGTISAIAAGEDHTCALTADGAVWCWGDNEYGQLGDGSTITSPTPVAVTGLPGNISAIAAGLYHTCALTADGAVWCWGDNEYGQLGDGSTTDSPTPVAVTGLPGGISAIAAGYGHTCALTADGAVWCWGDNRYGQLGDGSTINRPTPVAVTGLPGTISAIAAGGWHTCALTADGEVWCWGANWYGQLGDGSTTDSAIPLAVTGLPGTIADISAGGRHTCALTADGAVWCWGANWFGQLGDGSTISSPTPLAVSGLPGNISAIAAGGWHTCALATGGAVWCWGYNSDGQLGDGSTITSATPVAVSGLPGTISAIAAGSSHTCALTADGAVWCWGNNYYGQLGDGSTTDSPTPVAVSGLPGTISAIAANGAHTCALTADGAVWCWGDNEYGQLGDGSTTDSPTPLAVSGLPGNISAIAAGFDHTCALTADGAVWCWGYNRYGQLGDGSTINRPTPVAISGLPGTISAIAAGYSHTCALTADGAVWCWGYNRSGQLGDGRPLWYTTPVGVVGFH